MAMAQVWNDNFLPFTQDFEGETVHIEANHFITMDLEKARNFAGTYFPIQVDAGGRQKPQSFKKIRVEPIGMNDLAKLKDFKCHACNFYGQDKKDLEEHTISAHLHQMSRDDADKLLKRRKATA